jgi:hypothetical protein
VCGHEETGFPKHMSESDGEKTTGSETVESTEERVIRVIPIVTTLSFVRTVKNKVRGVRVTLTCYNWREYDRCAKTTRDTIGKSPWDGKGPWDDLGSMGKSKVTLDIMNGKEITST